ncbi:PAS domain S-box protein [Flavobacterium sp.]|jgi:PAS domain S-box-containing protein|uniref:PAS domain S-box protein n=1 Tax=Flavobacterium sp. TaxID=239 RepID=UPI0037BE4A55
MDALEFKFDENNFNRLFPFYILIDNDLKIKSFGKSLAKICPEIQNSFSFVSCFEISRPHLESPTFHEIVSNSNQLSVIKCKKSEISLRGQFELVNDSLLFVGSPWFQSMIEVVEKKLTLHDFALHDPLLDLLHVLNNQENNSKELKELLTTINNQKNKLKLANKEIHDIALFPMQNPDPLIRIDTNGNLLKRNPAAEKLSSFVHDGIHYETEDFFKFIITKIDLDKERYIFETQTDGKEFSFVCKSLKEEGYVNIYGIDITEQKKAQEELNRLSLVASSNDNGIVFTERDGKIFWCNDAYIKHTGYTKEEIYGKTPVEIGRLPESSIEEIRKMVVAFGNNEPFDVEILHKTKSGKKFWSRTKGQPIKDANGTTIQYFAMVDDVSKEKIKEERLQILSSIADVNINAVIICDKDGKIEWVNNSFENITGYKLAEVIGKTPGSILQGEESNPDTVKYLRDQIKAGESFNCEILNYSKSKKKYWIRIQGQPLKDKNGELIKYFATEEDISLEKNYYESIKSEKEKYSNIIANMNMGLLEVDNHDTILLANQSFCEMSGYTLLDLIGTKASDLLSNISDKKVIQTKNEMRSSGISDSYEVTAKTKDGQTKFWMISGAPNYNVNGEIVGSIGVHLDITQQKSLELQKEQLLARLEKQNEQLNEYAQIVSHDLKSPLRSIHSLISWIKEDNIGEFSPQSVEYLKMIESKVEKMDHLIHGILTYSKIDTLDLANEKINLNDVIDNIINIIHIPDNIKVTIVSKLPTIVADKYRIQQLFQNLIGNAVTYIDKPNGLVEVDFTEEEEHFIFSIKDNGPGIALENQEKIFKVFQSFTKNEKSTGIGLSIVKRIVDNYKGEIWIESQLTLGTTFFVKLPKKYN